MKYILSLCSIIILASNINLCQNIKSWTQTTAEEFSGNTLSNLNVTNNNGGEVQLPNPLNKFTDDYNDDLYLRSVSKDSNGNYIKTWVQNNNIFVKKYSASGTEITKDLIVTKAGNLSVSDPTSDIFDDGVFMVVWQQSNNDFNSATNIYGQIFTGGSVRTGSTILIADSVLTANNHPVVLACKSDQKFRVFMTFQVADGYKINFMEIDKNGNKISELLRLNKNALTENEFQPKAIDYKNYIYLTWAGVNDNSSVNMDIYACRYNMYGKQINSIIKVNDDTSKYTQNFPNLAADKEGRLFIVWCDQRNITDNYGSYSNIMGQYFDSTFSYIGNNIQINSYGVNKENSNPEIAFGKDIFNVSWIYYDEKKIRFYTYVNEWKYLPVLYGEMVSSVFGSGSSDALFQKFSWNTVIKDGAGLKFQLRGGNTLEQLKNAQWLGPEDNIEYYIYNSGTQINKLMNKNKYIQYKAIFSSLNGATAILESVNITYLPLDTLAPSKPLNVKALSGHSSGFIKWDPNSEPDLMEYKIYRRRASEKYDLNKVHIIKRDITSFQDTSTETGTQYFYVISAIDSNYNESEVSDEVSVIPYGINIYVSSAVGINGDGTINNPFKMIQDGINAAKKGDTVRVFAGNYPDSFDMKSRVSLIGENTENCIISTPVNPSDSCIIKKLTFTRLITFNNVSPVLTENIIKGEPEYNALAIYIYSHSSPEISKNYLIDWKQGIQTGSECYPLIRNNIIIAENGIMVEGDVGATVINNTVIASEGYPLHAGAWLKCTMMNNILVGYNTNLDLNGHIDTNLHTLAYNDFWNFKTPAVQTGTNNIYQSPEFVNETMQDYRLKTGSPCINKGNPLPVYNDNDGSRNDIGAFGGPDPIVLDYTNRLIKTISLSRISGYPKDTIVVEIQADNPSGISSGKIKIKYDDNILTFKDAELTNITENFTVHTASVSASEVSIELSNGNIIEPKTSSIIKLNFIVKDNLTTGSASSISVKEVKLYDNNLNEIGIRKIDDGIFIVGVMGESAHFIYVNKLYSGQEEGTFRKPFTSITNAIKHSNDGDTIIVSSGTYNEVFSMKNNIYLIGSGSAVTVIETDIPGQSILFEDVISGEISGFTLHTPLICNNSSPVIKNNCLNALNSFSSLTCYNHSSPVIENNYFKNANISWKSSTPVVRNNIIDGNMTGSDNSDIIIEKNLIYLSSSGFGIEINGGTAHIKNNYIYCNGTPMGIYLHEAATNVNISNNIIKVSSGMATGIYMSGASGSKIYNNTIISMNNGVMEDNSISELYNNIIINSNSIGVKLSPGSVNNYNNVWNNYTNYYYTTPGLNNISAYPIFTDTLKGNYSIAVGSPCIDAGNPDVSFNDKDGSRNDIGAYGGPYLDFTWYNKINSSLEAAQSTNMPSDTIVVDIISNNMNNASNINLALSYDPKLLKMSYASTTTLTANYAITRYATEEGKANLILNCDKGIEIDSGKIIKLFFEILSNQKQTTDLVIDSASITDAATFTRKINNIKNITIDVLPVSVSSNPEIIKEYKLYQNYPNPFNPETRIRYELPRESNVILSIYNILGERICELVNTTQKAGNYEVKFNAENYASGIYFYQLKANDFIKSKKFILMK